MVNIVLCGGSGTRLWPISRTLMPKQFVKMFEDGDVNGAKKSLFQMSVERNSKICSGSFIVSNREQYFLALDQLEELQKKEDSRFLLEPVGRNTAPAIALACFALERDDVVLVTPSDHIIKDEKSYFKAVEVARESAEDGYLVTFGINPSHPETGFGYIQAKERDGERVFDVRAFIEKPNIERAREYFEAGNFYWNSGMFMFKVGVFLEELKKHSPSIYESSLYAYKNAKGENPIRVSYDDMHLIPEDSIDYALMEKSSTVKVVPSSIGWSDLGSFDALYDELPKDENGNTKNRNMVSISGKNSLVLGEERLIAIIDVEDLIVVDSSDALLISRKGSSQKVKEVVQLLKSGGSQLHNTHLTVHRPWGKYTVLEKSSGYKIKKIVVKPNKRLSLQKHFHRSEHWIVVSGTATVTVGDKRYLVRPNESTYIRMGEVHRLENEGKIPVVLIEVQVGEYTGEDDIVRIEDDFKRE